MSYYFMPSWHTFHMIAQMVYDGLGLAASFYSTQYAAFVNWVLLSYTLPNQLNWSPSDLDSAL